MKQMSVIYICPMTNAYLFRPEYDYIGIFVKLPKI